MNNKELQKIIKKTAADRLVVIFMALIALIVSVENFIKFFTTADPTFQELSDGFHGLFLFGILFILWIIIMDIKRSKKPFSKSVVKLLNILAIWTLLASLIPDIASNILYDLVMTDFKYIGYNVTDVITSINISILVLAAAIGIIADIFNYGCQLQDDVDSFC